MTIIQVKIKYANNKHTHISVEKERIKYGERQRKMSDNNKMSSKNKNNNQGRPLAKYKVGNTVLYVSGIIINRNRYIERIGTIIKSRWEMMNGLMICKYMMRNCQQSLSGSLETIWINENDIISRR